MMSAYRQIFSAHAVTQLVKSDPIDLEHEIQVHLLQGGSWDAPAQLSTWSDVLYVAMYIRHWKLSRGQSEPLLRRLHPAAVPMEFYTKLFEHWGVWP